MLQSGSSGGFRCSSVIDRSNGATLAITGWQQAKLAVGAPVHCKYRRLYVQTDCRSLAPRSVARAPALMRYGNYAKLVRADLVDDAIGETGGADSAGGVPRNMAPTFGLAKIAVYSMLELREER